MFKKDRISVFYTIDDRCADLCTVSMVSILDNTKKDVDFYILNSNLTSQAKNKINSVKKSEFIQITQKPSIDKKPYSFYKFFAPDCFKNIKKGIFLHADTIFLDDINKLWQKDISNFLIGGVCDVWNFKNNIERFNLKSESYFNEGVLLVNFEKWRKDKILNKIKTMLEKNKYSAIQLLNILSDTQKLDLSPDFNCMEPWWYNYYVQYEGKLLEEYNKIKNNPMVVHFTGIKPDCYSNSHSQKEKWWNYASKLKHFPEIVKKYREVAETQKPEKPSGNIFTVRKYNQKTERVLNIYTHSIGGLGNRLKQIFTRMYQYKGQYDTVDIHWNFGGSVYSRFYDLFRPEFFERINEIDYSVFLDNNCRVDDTWCLLLNDSERKKISSEVQYGLIDFQYEKIPQLAKDVFLPFFQGLKPSYSVQGLIDKVSLPEKCVAVQIRHSKDWKEWKRWAEDDISLFISEMEKYDIDTYFYLVCHLKETEEIIKKHFKERIITLPDKDYDLKDNRQHVADLYLLSKPKDMIITYGSTFSEVAWWLGNCKQNVKIIGNQEKWDKLACK